ncbi:hypothetical protein [Paenibacillus chibensis]|nr:hypothetical protein [Paenibacillus chibensis]MEC0369200.1 hypothetical protein [Paenibacillus chibensis]
MIDDLCNTWVDTGNKGYREWGDDWGFFKREEKSSFRYLNEQILALFPEVKVTFFVPVGIRAGISVHPLYQQISRPLDADEESRGFFKFIHQHPKFELAYHGTTHGNPGEAARDFVQEWHTFHTIEEAVETIRAGLVTFQNAAGERPSGGKYCGYAGSKLADESIDRSGFTWWCRYWNHGYEDMGDGPDYGEDADPISRYEIKRFGANGVIDIPSTVNGGLLRGLTSPDYSFKGIAKRALKRPLIRYRLRKLDYLLKHRLVISIQEHIAPSRDDGKIQHPNIFHDRNSLVEIFRYLATKKVWYCTGTELADYVNLRDHIKLVQIDESGFELVHDLRYENWQISLQVEDSKGMHILAPDHRKFAVLQGAVNLPVMQGKYLLQRGGVY